MPCSAFDILNYRYILIKNLVSFPLWKTFSLKNVPLQKIQNIIMIQLYKLIFIEIKKLDPFFLFLKNLLKGKKSDTCIFTESELFVVGGLV